MRGAERLRAQLRRAAERRAPLLASGRTTAYRWVHGRADGLDGVTVDVFGDVLVLALYAEDSEMTSDKIPALGFDAGGTLRGKENLRAYWGKALALLPNLHFTLIDTYVSPDSVVVFYQNERAAKICEYLRLDAAGKIRQGSANHLAH